MARDGTGPVEALMTHTSAEEYAPAVGSEEATRTLFDDFLANKALPAADGWQHSEPAPGLRTLGAATPDGRGMYLQAFEPVLPGVLLQAPHRFYDRQTGTIVARLIDDGCYPAAAAFNTAQRYTADHSDLTHRTDSAFNTFTCAFLDVHPDGLVVQLHGFTPEYRSTASGRSSAIIVADGTRCPGKHTQGAVDCLRQAWPKSLIRLYPSDVRELGATEKCHRSGCACGRWSLPPPGTQPHFARRPG